MSQDATAPRSTSKSSEQIGRDVPPPSTGERLQSLPQAGAQLQPYLSYSSFTAPPPGQVFLPAPTALLSATASPIDRNPPSMLPRPEPRYGRPLDVSTILNPTESGLPQPKRRRKSSGLAETGRPSTEGDEEYQTQPQVDPLRAEGIMGAPASPTPGLRSRAGSLRKRGTLNPRSPLQRTTSLGRMAGPGQISIPQTLPPLIAGRVYTADPRGSESVPPMPHGGSVAHYLPPAAPTPPTTGRRPSGRLPLSTSASPSTSYSPASQPGYRSPTIQQSAPFGQTQGGPLLFGSSAAPMTGPPHVSVAPPSSMGGDARFNTPVGTTQQSSYQMTTIHTQQGSYQLPVDMLAASKQADEKRRRNAGASARFRERRKQREREANTAIARLETEVRAMSEARDYYRTERDYFRSVAYSSNPHLQLPPRPPSPRPSTFEFTYQPSAFDDVDSSEEPEKPQRQSIGMTQNPQAPQGSTYTLTAPPPQGTQAPGLAPSEMELARAAYMAAPRQQNPRGSDPASNRPEEQRGPYDPFGSGRPS